MSKVIRGKKNNIAEIEYYPEDRELFINSMDIVNKSVFMEMDYDYNPWINSDLEFKFYIQDTAFFWDMVKDVTRNDKYPIDYESELFWDTWCGPAICGSIPYGFDNVYNIDYLEIEVDSGNGFGWDQNWTYEKIKEEEKYIPEYIRIYLTDSEKTYLMIRMEELFQQHFGKNVRETLRELYDNRYGEEGGM